MPHRPDDLTAKARIREAALELFGRDGVGGTSMRSIAARAGVSPSLVVHHYGSKEALHRAVDEAVVEAFGTALGSVDLDAPVDEIGRQLEASISGLIGGDEHVRRYLARGLVDGDDASHGLVSSLLDLIDEGLRHLDAGGHLSPGLDPTWRTYTVASVILGPIFLAGLIEARTSLDAFAPEVVRARSACSTAILREGLFAG